MTEYIQVVTTTETRTDAQEIANTVVTMRLAGCAQIIGPITSTYWWQEKIETAKEWVCVIKTRETLYQKLEKAILELHPYEVPEVLATPVKTGSKSYLDWLDDNTLD
jgi:periplasmic divalent cation tolerance protein